MVAPTHAPPRHPALVALERAPRDPSVLTDEDRARIEENKRRRAAGEKGRTQAEIEAMIAERARKEG